MGISSFPSGSQMEQSLFGSSLQCLVVSVPSHVFPGDKAELYFLSPSFSLKLGENKFHHVWKKDAHLMGFCSPEHSFQEAFVGA